MGRRNFSAKEKPEPATRKFQSVQTAACIPQLIHNIPIRIPHKLCRPQDCRILTCTIYMCLCILFIGEMKPAVVTLVNRCRMLLRFRFRIKTSARACISVRLTVPAVRKVFLRLIPAVELFPASVAGIGYTGVVVTEPLALGTGKVQPVLIVEVL